MTAPLARLVALVLPLVLGACAAVAAPPLEAPDVPDGVPLVASGTAFDRSVLGVQADRPFSLVFVNGDGAPHNVSIAPASGGAPLFVGEVFGGPAVRVYSVPALAAGRYTFRCDVHPEMTGTLVSE